MILNNVKFKLSINIKLEKVLSKNTKVHFINI